MDDAQIRTAKNETIGKLIANRYSRRVLIAEENFHYDAKSTPVKRTALGRFKREAATVSLSADGRIGDA